MKPLALVLAAASSLAIAASTPAFAGHSGVSEQEMVQKFMRVFDRLDHNRNDILTRRGLRDLESSGYRRNSHGNTRIGVVFGDENFRIAFGTSIGGRRSGQRSYIGPINSRTFYLYDLDNDGRIRRRELRRAVSLEFYEADIDGDGWLSERELRQSGWLRTSVHVADRSYYPDYRRTYRRPIYIGTGSRRHRGHNDTNRHRSGPRDGYRDGTRHRDGARHRDGTRSHVGARTRDDSRHRDGARSGTRGSTQNHNTTRTRDRTGDRTGDHKATRDRNRTQDRDSTHNPDRKRQQDTKRSSKRKHEAKRKRDGKRTSKEERKHRDE